MAVTIKSKEEIQCMRDAGKILAEVHEKLAEIIAPGITSLEIDRKGEELIRNAGCIPSFKGYEGYPASICVSINDEVVHGIPSKEHHLFDWRYCESGCRRNLQRVSVRCGKNSRCWNN